MQQISIQVVAPHSPLLTDIIALGDKYRKYLGLLSPDVYSERVERKRVLPANRGVAINLRVQNGFRGGNRFVVGRVRDLDNRRHVVGAI